MAVDDPRSIQPDSDNAHRCLCGMMGGNDVRFTPGRAGCVDRFENRHGRKIALAGAPESKTV